MRNQITESRCGRGSEIEQSQQREGTCGGGSLGDCQIQGTMAPLAFCVGLWGRAEPFEGDGVKTTYRFFP